jgi:hypothetical protein
MNPFAAQPLITDLAPRRGGTGDASLSSDERRDLAGSLLILEPYDDLLAEGARDPFERRQTRHVLPALQPADGRHTRLHACGQLTLREAVPDPPGNDHPREGLVRLEPRSLGAVLLAVPGPSTPQPTAMSWLLMLTIHRLGYYQF